MNEQFEQEELEHCTIASLVGRLVPPVDCDESVFQEKSAGKV
jgi:hypothetical protein